MNHQSLTAAAAQLLERSNLVLSRWAAHRMAIKMSAGGRDSLQKMQQTDHLLFNLLSESKEQVHIDYGEDIVNELMLSLNTEIGDCNIGEVCLLDLFGLNFRCQCLFTCVLWCNWLPTYLETLICSLEHNVEDLLDLHVYVFHNFPISVEILKFLSTLLPNPLLQRVNIFVYFMQSIFSVFYAISLNFAITSTVPPVKAMPT